MDGRGTDDWEEAMRRFDEATPPVDERPVRPPIAALGLIGAGVVGMSAVAIYVATQLLAGAAWPTLPTETREAAAPATTIATAAADPASGTSAPQPDARAAGRSAPAMPPAANPERAGPWVQIGAYGSEDAARRAWTATTERFGSARSLEFRIAPVEVGGRTLHRLRAVGGDAAALCADIRAAGGTCTTGA